MGRLTEVSPDGLW